MKTAILICSLFFFPTFAFAACSEKGASVVYINGIFTSLTTAKIDLNKLRTEYGGRTGDDTVKFYNGYNPSHLAGVGDVTQAAAQVLDSSISGFDLTTILLQIHPQVTTRKLVLVGHSQGAFYANEMYSYLLAHGEPKAAVGVYHVGTPASTVSGSGKYLTSSNDAIINAARLIASSAADGLVPLAAAGTAPKAKAPLPANITLSGAGNGHSFSGAYLAEAPERVVGDIQGTLKKLKAELATEVGECFTAPNAGLGYQATKAGFAVADTAAAGIRTGAGAAQVAAVAAGNVLASAVQGAYGVAGKLATDIGTVVGGAVGITHAAEPQSRPTNFDLFKKLYGSSLTKEDYREFLSDLGGAVATAPVFAQAPVPQEQATPEVKKITYLSGKGRDDSEPGPETPAPGLVPEATTTEPATTTEEIVAPAQEATTTEPVTEPATTTPSVPEPASITLASQEDESHLCNDEMYGGWRNCYVGPNTSFYSIELGSGLEGALDSLTIAAHELDFFHPYLITIECFVDEYATPCTDWVMPGPATGNRADAVIQKASENLGDGKYWIAYFAFNENRYQGSGTLYPKDASGSTPVMLNPAHYYRLTIDDLEWSAGVFGSATEPYWVLTGIK